MSAALSALAISAIAAVEVAEAVVIFDNGPLVLGGANEIGIASDKTLDNGQVADDFVLTAGTTFNRIVWWGGPAIVDDFGIQFFTDAGGRPAADPFLELAIGDVAERPSLLPDPFDEAFEYVADVSPITLDLNVTYWLSIFNNAADPRVWFWSVAGLGNLHFRNESTPDWTTHRFADSNLGFRLVQVPEPPMLLLVFTGVIISVGARCARRRKRTPRHA